MGRGNPQRLKLGVVVKTPSLIYLLESVHKPCQCEHKELMRIQLQVVPLWRVTLNMWLIEIVAAKHNCYLLCRCYAPSVWLPEVVTIAHGALYQHTTLVSRPNRRILIRRVGTRHHWWLTRSCQDAKGKRTRKAYVGLGNLYFIREGNSSVYASHLKSLKGCWSSKERNTTKE